MCGRGGKRHAAAHTRDRSRQVNRRARAGIGNRDIASIRSRGCGRQADRDAHRRRSRSAARAGSRVGKAVRAVITCRRDISDHLAGNAGGAMCGRGGKRHAAAHTRDRSRQVNRRARAGIGNRDAGSVRSGGGSRQADRDAHRRRDRSAAGAGGRVGKAVRPVVTCSRRIAETGPRCGCRSVRRCRRDRNAVCGSA